MRRSRWVLLVAMLVGVPVVAHLALAVRMAREGACLAQSLDNVKEIALA